MESAPTDFPLEHPPHPFDICTALPFVVGSGWWHAGTGCLAHEGSKTSRRKNRRVTSRQETDEIKGAGLWQPDDQVISPLPCTLVTPCLVPNVVPHGIV